MENLDVKEAQPAIKQVWLRILLMLLSFIIALMMVQGIAIVLYAVFTHIALDDMQEIMKGSENQGMRFLLEFVSLAVTVFLTWIFRKHIDKKSFISLGLHVKGKTKDMIGGFSTGFILMLVGFLALKFGNGLQVTNIEYNSQVVFGGLFFFIIVGVSEELLFRGYILKNLMESSINKYLALLISAVLFALMHGLNPNISIIALINLVMAGLALGITYIHTQNIWFPIFLHISWNYFQGPIFGFQVSGLETESVITHSVSGSKLITGGEFGFEGSILITFLLLAFIIFADILLRRKNQPTN